MKNLKRCSVLKQGNTSYSDSSKPVYKLIEELNEISDISRLEQEVKQLKNIIKGYRFETATLKESLSKAGELIEELKARNLALKTEMVKGIEILNKTMEEIPSYNELKEKNKLLKAQLHRFGEIFDNFESKRKELNNQKENNRDSDTNN